MTYRSDDEAMAQRQRILAAELDELRARTLQVEDDLAVLRREREGWIRELSVASPCTQRWGDLVGDERVRFCKACGKNVYNAAAMTQREVEAMVRSSESAPCMRLFRRADGTLITSDCTAQAKSLRRLVVVAAGLGGGVCTLAVAAELTRPVMSFGMVSSRVVPVTADDESAPSASTHEVDDTPPDAQRAERRHEPGSPWGKFRRPWPRRDR